MHKLLLQGPKLAAKSIELFFSLHAYISIQILKYCEFSYNLYVLLYILPNNKFKKPFMYVLSKTI